MKDILSRASLDVLQQFAWSKVLLAFDYDGTLAPIVADPEHASMRGSTRRLLAAIAERYPCIVVSGRSRRDVAHRMEGIPLQQIVGNHGIEPWLGTVPVREEVSRCAPILEECLSSLKGVRIENKAFSISVHYRRSREKKKAVAAILEAAARLGSVRVIGGKEVVNILPDGLPHKGTALESERERLGCDTALYLGDDQTDEDVFALDQPGRLLGIRVGASRASQAAYFVRSKTAVDQLLRLLLELRPPRRLAARS
jgi:trehalose 6-phosphate phosphatase